MASSKTVTVLAPNGRRQNVKVTPNTTILQILEEVCKKHELQADDYDIKHYNHILDVTAMMRFSGLPNNAQLEMCAIQKLRNESSVTLGLQLESGTRVTGNFIPQDNLWNILQKLCPDDVKPEKNPVVIYMRQEIYGLHNLQNTSLKSLGLTSGRAMLRLIHRKPEQLQTQANVSAPLPIKPVQERPYVRKMIKLDNEPEVITKEVNLKEEPSSKKVEFSPPKSPKSFLSDLVKKEKLIKSADGARVKSSGPRTDTKMEVDSTDDKLADRVPSEEIVFLGERSALAFSLDMARAVPHDDLPDEFYELTLQDARKLFNELKKKRIELEENPLQTNALRQLEENKKVLRQLSQYKTSVIRVQFPDRTVLQGSFKPLDTIQVVKNFVKEYLADASKSFHLYTTPPKSVLCPDLSLAEAECVPSAVVHFSYDNAVKDDHKYLRQTILSQFTSHSLASLAATRSRGNEINRLKSEDNEVEEMDLTTNDTITTNVSDRAQAGASTSGAGPSGAGPSHAPQSAVVKPAGPPEKVPKWFKPTK